MRGSMTDRFWSRVTKIDTCWLWQGKPMKVGYGYISDESGKDSYAHRVSWIMHNGPIPAGSCVLHKCDVRLCVNPEHLFLGTRTDNQQDAANKGRLPHGEKHWNTKLSDDDVLGIIDYVKDGISHSRTAKMFGVCRQTVGSIMSGRIRRRTSEGVVPA